jgi:hypothetical protein
MLRRHRNLASFVVILALALLPACGDEDDGSMNPGASLQGTWEADTFSAGGTDYVATGLGVTITFTATTFVVDVTGDTNGVVCDTPGDCVNTGTLSYTSSTITFDAGTADEITFNYTVTATTLTLSGDIDGTALSATFTRT